MNSFLANMIREKAKELGISPKLLIVAINVLLEDETATNEDIIAAYLPLVTADVRAEALDAVEAKDGLEKAAALMLEKYSGQDAIEIYEDPRYDISDFTNGNGLKVYHYVAWSNVLKEMNGIEHRNTGETLEGTFVSIIFLRCADLIKHCRAAGELSAIHINDN